MPHIEKSLEAFFDKDSSDGEIVDKLLVLGFKTFEAERIAVFAPVVFGRQIINSIADISYPDEFEVEGDGGIKVKILYSEEPVFIELNSIAELSFTSKSLPKENFYAIANRSWELSGVNQILRDLEAKTETFDTSMLNGTKLSPMKIWGYDSFLPSKKGFIGNVLSRFFKES